MEKDVKFCCEFTLHDQSVEIELTGLIVLTDQYQAHHIPITALNAQHWLLTSPETAIRAWPITKQSYLNIHGLVGAAGLGGDPAMVWEIGRELGLCPIDYATWAAEHGFGLRSLPKEFAPIPLMLAYPLVDQAALQMEGLSYGFAAVGVNALAAIGGLLGDEYEDCNDGAELLANIREHFSTVDAGAAQPKQVH